MKKDIRNIFAAILCGALLGAGTACSGSDKDKVKIARLDQDTYRYSRLAPEARGRVLDSLRPELSALVRVTGLDSVATDYSVMAWADSHPVHVFAPMVQLAFPDLDRLEAQLGHVRLKARELGLELPRRRYASVVWGNPKSIIFDDTVALIALNHYLGPESPAYANWPEYRRLLKNPDFVIYDIAEAVVATAYPYKAADARPRQNVAQPVPDLDNEDVDDIPDMPEPEPAGTLLNRLLYEGALVYAKTQLVEDATDELALGFTAEQLNDIVANRSFTWNKLVTEKMLYSTDPELHARLFSLLPHSTPLSGKAPGRALRYTGLEIVRAYVKNHPEATLTFLLSPEFYNGANTLRDSGYTAQ